MRNCTPLKVICEEGMRYSCLPTGLSPDRSGGARDYFTNIELADYFADWLRRIYQGGPNGLIAKAHTTKLISLFTAKYEFGKFRLNGQDYFHCGPTETGFFAAASS